MGTLIDDMLQLSRITRAEMRRVRVDIAALAREVVTALQQECPDRKMEAAIASDMEVEGDPGLLKIALENLVGNSWKFTSKSPAAKIEIGVEQDAGRPVYFVRDNGAGFSMSHAEKLFRPFQRLHAEKEFPGTGVGLATVQRVIERHGGRVWAEGKPGRGACFRFTLPPAA
jgi:signal transduction histidine kinase